MTRSGHNKPAGPENLREGSRSRLKSGEREELGEFAQDDEEGNYAHGDYRWRNGGPKPAMEENGESAGEDRGRHR